jgi:hypothetical protein
MIRIFLAASVALLAQPALAQSVEVAEGDWSGIPVAASIDGPEWMSAASMDRIDKLVAAGKCPRAGNKRRINLNVPFLMQFDGGGVAQRIVVQRLGCPELETVLSGIIRGRLLQGFYKPTGKNEAGWYRSQITYSLD